MVSDKPTTPPTTTSGGTPEKNDFFENPLELAMGIREIAKGLSRIADVVEGKHRTRVPLRTDSKESMNLEQFTKSCKEGSSSRHIHLIGDWAKVLPNKEIEKYETRGQWRAFIKRHLADARDLAEFSDEQLLVAFKKMKEGNVLKPTMKTVLKYLT